MSGDVLYISGGNPCSFPYSGFTGNKNIQTDNSGSGCRLLTFQGLSGIQTFKSGDTLGIGYTGAKGCKHAFTGFQTDQTGSTYNKTGCRDLGIFGTSGVATKTSSRGVFVAGLEYEKADHFLITRMTQAQELTQ